MSSAAISFKTISIPAGGAVKVNVQGELFVCEESSAAFEMSFDHGEKFPCRGGFTLRPPGGFKFLTFYNSTSAAITVTFFTGDTFVSYNYTRETPTRMVPDNYIVNEGTFEDHPGVNAGNRRKQIIITNANATGGAHIELMDANSGIYVAKILAATAFTVATDADLRVQRRIDGLGNAEVQVMELFYRS